MQSFSIILNSIQIKHILSQLRKYQVDPPKNEQIRYFHKVNGNTITIYKNNRMLIQGQDAEPLGKKLLGEKQENIAKSTIADYVGCDEVGVGDYFGGLVTCAVYLKKADEEKLKKLGVKDSKNLTDEIMLNIFPQLITCVEYSLVDYFPCEYNALVDEYRNTHIVKAYMHDKAIKTLFQKCKLTNSTEVVMDQFVDESTYYKYFKTMQIVNPAKITRFETKAENKYLAVAAASIIARVTFLKQIQKLSNMANKKLLLGASNPMIITQAREIYNLGGKKLLNKYVKIDFKTTHEVVKK